MAASKESLKSVIDQRDRDFLSFVQQQFSHLRNQHAKFQKKTIEKITKLQSECGVNLRNGNCLQNYQNKMKIQYESLSGFMNYDVNECEKNILSNSGVTWT